MATTREIGVISDTHGLLRPEALRALAGVERILHAGDVGDERILPALGQIAPVVAVRGNVDYEPWTQRLRQTEVIEIDACLIYMLHDLGALDLDPATSGFHAVITGHSHRPEIRREGGVLFLNPGSAGPRRFDLPVTIARLSLQNNTLTARIVTLFEGQTG